MSPVLRTPFPSTPVPSASPAPSTSTSTNWNWPAQVASWDQCLVCIRNLKAKLPFVEFEKSC
jgi:hypothetical protein